jgi:hypothetical protein
VSHDLKAFEQYLIRQRDTARANYQRAVARDKPTGKPSDTVNAAERGQQFGIVIATELALDQLHTYTWGEYGQTSAQQQTSAKAVA